MRGAFGGDVWVHATNPVGQRTVPRGRAPGRAREDVDARSLEDDLLRRGMGLINSGPCHPQTNGKLERFRRAIWEDAWNYDNPGGYVAYHSKGRLRRSPDTKSCQTPLKTLRGKAAGELAREGNPP